jgi:Uri superfamily endonuclease
VKGIYSIVIRVYEDISVRVGALGKIDFEKGIYVYVGSAQTNLEQRVNRHLRKDKRLFWHVDYLLNNDAAKIVDAFYMQGEKAFECAIANQIDTRGERINGFGCSDCRCKSHLFRVKNYSFLCESMQRLQVKN